MRLRALRSLFLVLAVGLVVGVMALSSLGMAPASRVASPTSSPTPIPPLVTTTTGKNATATYDDATVVLSATVTTTVNGIPFAVAGGGISFTVRTLNGFPVGKPVTTKVQSGFASATFNLPSGEKTGTYNVYPSYAGEGSVYAPSNGQSTLTINPANWTLTVANVTAPVGDTSVPLSATLATTSGAPISDGAVRFLVTDANGAKVGLAATGKPVNGNVTAYFGIPKSAGAGAYTISATFLNNANYVTSPTPSTGTLTLQ